MAAQELVDASGGVGRDTVPARENMDAVSVLPANNPVEGDAAANEPVVLCNAIQARKNKAEYPLVLPIEVASDGLQREFADEQCTFVRGMGIVQFQSFLTN